MSEHIFSTPEVSEHISSEVSPSTIRHRRHRASELGVSQTFMFMAKEELERGQLVSILQDWNPPRDPFHVLYPPNRHLSDRVRVFIDWLVASFENLD